MGPHRARSGRCWPPPAPGWRRGRSCRAWTASSASSARDSAAGSRSRRSAFLLRILTADDAEWLGERIRGLLGGWMGRLVRLAGMAAVRLAAFSGAFLGVRRRGARVRRPAREPLDPVMELAVLGPGAPPCRTEMIRRRPGARALAAGGIEGQARRRGDAALGGRAARGAPGHPPAERPDEMPWSFRLETCLGGRDPGPSRGRRGALAAAFDRRVEWRRVNHPGRGLRRPRRRRESRPHATSRGSRGCGRAGVGRESRSASSHSRSRGASGGGTGRRGCARPPVSTRSSASTTSCARSRCSPAVELDIVGDGPEGRRGVDLADILGVAGRAAHAGWSEDTRALAPPLGTPCVLPFEHRGPAARRSSTRCWPPAPVIATPGRQGPRGDPPTSRPACSSPSATRRPRGPGIRRLLDDPAGWERLATAGRGPALAHYTRPGHGPRLRGPLRRDPRG